jgi:hypothetical protein
VPGLTAETWGYSLQTLYRTEMKAALPIIRCFVLPEEVLRTRNERDIPLMHVEDHDPLDRLQEAARGHRNTRTWPRVQAVILAKQGDPAPQFARAPGVSRRAAGGTTFLRSQGS